MRSSKKKYETIDDKTLKELHKVGLELLDWTTNICEKNNLNYFLAGGTLIGAVRHKGFIPWDDDIDISMPREDFEKFLDITSENKDENYFVQYNTSEKKYWLPFIKIRKRNTYFEEEGSDKYKGEKGIFIDIFPLDYAPKKDSLIQNIQAHMVKSITRILRWRIISCGSLLKVILLGRTLNFLPTKSLFKLREKLMKMYNKKTTTYFINLGSQYNYKRQTVLKSKFLPCNTLTFEGKKYHVPHDYEYVLKSIYGNYMKLPPLEKRVIHLIGKPIFNTKNEDIK